MGRPLLAEAARRYGLAALAINNCYHFSALWADIEELACSGFVALAMTIGMHCVTLAVGGRPLGTNPIAFAFPRGLHNEPFVFDLSTSVVARGEIELHRRASITLPPDWAIDEAGVPTTDPVAALRGAILPFGGHKGAALGLMLLAGPLIGDLRSASALQVDTGDGGPLRGGYLMLAIDPAHFGDGNANIAEADQWLASLADDHRPARLPGSRRLAHRVTARAEGIRIPAELYEAIRNVSG